MIKVVLDTNFLLIPGQFKIDIFSEIERIVTDKHEICILEGSLEELKKLAEGNSKDAMAAKLGFVLAQQKHLKSMPSSQKHVDDDLVSLVKEDMIIATQDKDLKKRIREQNGKIITMRQKQHLVLEG